MGLTTAPSRARSGQTAGRLASAQTAAASVLHGPGALSGGALPGQASNRCRRPRPGMRCSDCWPPRIGRREGPRAPALPQGLDLLRPVRLPADRLPRQRPRRHLSLLHLHRPPTRQDELQTARHPHRAGRGRHRCPLRHGPASRGRRSPRLRAYLGRRAGEAPQDAERERMAQTRRLGQLEGERKKLLDAHYAEAIPLDLLKSEQDRLTAEISQRRRPLGGGRGRLPEGRGQPQLVP